MICSLPKKCDVKRFRALGAVTLCQSRTFTASALLQPRKTCNPLVLVFAAVQQNIGGGGGFLCLFSLADCSKLSICIIA